MPVWRCVPISREIPLSLDIPISFGIPTLLPFPFNVAAVALLNDQFTFHVRVECAGVVVRAFRPCDVAPRCSRLHAAGIESRLLAWPSAVAVWGTLSSFFHSTVSP